MKFIGTVLWPLVCCGAIASWMLGSALPMVIFLAAAVSSYIFLAGNDMV